MMTLCITIYLLVGLIFGFWPGQILTKDGPWAVRIVVSLLLMVFWPIYVMACAIAVTVLISNG